MTTRQSSLTQIFLRGIGLKTALSYGPPIAVAWIFFILYLRGLPPAEFWTALGLGMAGIAVGSVVAIQLIFSIVPPLHRIIEVTHALREGELAVAIPYGTRADEIGDMARALDTFRRTAQDKQTLERDQSAQKLRAEEERRAALHQVAHSFEQHVGAVVQSVVASVSTLRGSAHSMAETAKSTSSQVGTVAQAAEAASTNVQEVASATEQLASEIARIAEAVKRAQDVTERADGAARDTTAMIRKLAESVTGIGEIVALINDIASQTNLLALNATIEAARAGESGKGFAVVANEVKHLANQTGRATEDITQRIQAIQSGTAEAVSAMRHIAETIGEMTGISGSVREAIERQDDATGAIVRNIENAARGTLQVSDNIHAVGNAARGTGDTAAAISTAAAALADQSARLQQEVNGFLGQVRSA